MGLKVRRVKSPEFKVSIPKQRIEFRSILSKRREETEMINRVSQSLLDVRVNYTTPSLFYVPKTKRYTSSLLFYSK